MKAGIEGRRRRSLRFIAVNGGKDSVAIGWKADEVIRAAGHNPVWSRLHNGWILYGRDVADVVAAADYRGIEVRGIDRTATESDASVGVAPATPVSDGAPVGNPSVGADVPLFDGPGDAA